MRTETSQPVKGGTKMMSSRFVFSGVGTIHLRENQNPGRDRYVKGRKSDLTGTG